MKKEKLIITLLVLLTTTIFAETRPIRPRVSGEGSIGTATYKFGAAYIETGNFTTLNLAGSPIGTAATNPASAFVSSALVGQPGGVAGLDANGQISTNAIPSITVVFTGGERE